MALEDWKIDDKVVFVKGTKKYAGKIGLIKKIDIDPKTEKVRLLLEGDGLFGAFNEEKKQLIKNSRNAYEDMVVKVI